MSGSKNPDQGVIPSRDNFLRRSAYVAAIRMVGLLCVFALQVILARLIGDSEEYGKYAWGQSLLFMAGALACMGLPVVTNRFIASLSAQGNEQAIAGISRRARDLLLRSSGFLVLLALMLSFFWRDAASDPVYRDVAILALLLAPGVTFAYLYQDMSRARHWLGLALLPLNVLRPVVVVLLAFCCWRLYDGNLSGTFVLGLAGISILVVLLPQALLYHWRTRHLVIAPDTLAAAADYHPSQLFRTALPVFVVRCAGLTINYSNVLLVGFLAGPAAAGAYFAAERLAQLAAIPKSVVSTVNQPSMAAAHAMDNPNDLQKITTQSAHGSLWPTLLIGLGLAVMANPLLHLLGDDFSAARIVLIMLVASHILDAFVGPAQDILIMTGRQKHIPKVMLFSATIHLIALFTLVPLLGAPGAAIATIASGLVSSVWLMCLAHNESGVVTTILGQLKR